MTRRIGIDFSGIMCKIKVSQRPWRDWGHGRLPAPSPSAPEPCEKVGADGEIQRNAGLFPSGCRVQPIRRHVADKTMVRSHHTKACVRLGQ